MTDFTFTAPRPATIGKYHPIVGVMTDVKGRVHGNEGDQSIVARVFKMVDGKYMVFLPSNHDPIHIKSWDKAKVVPTIKRAIAMREVMGINDYSLWLDIEDWHAEKHGHDGADCMCFEAEDGPTPDSERRAEYDKLVKHTNTQMRHEAPVYTK